MNIKIFLVIILLGLLILFVPLFALLGPAKVVMTDSMSPSYRAGDVLWIRPLAGPVAPGMVVSYEFQGKLITHRIVAIEGNQLVTRGDNNPEADPWRVPLSSVAGTPSFRIPYIGYAIFYLKQPVGWFLLVFLPALWIIIGEFRKIVGTLRAPRLPNA